MVASATPPELPAGILGADDVALKMASPPVDAPAYS
jgi:hypothetical protein